DSTGGQPAPAPGSAPAGDSGDPGVKLSSRKALFVGRTVRVRGSADSAAGRRIQIERRTPSGVWETVGVSDADRHGAFSLSWVPTRSGRFELRAVVTGSAESSETGSAARASSP